jgi:hypothetical protein
VIPSERVRLVGLSGCWYLSLALAVASAAASESVLAQVSSADSALACRTAIRVQRSSPDTRNAILAFDQRAALVCTALPAATDTLDILAALAERGGNRALVGHYALIVADQHFRRSRSSGDRRDAERALASFRVAYSVDSSRTTGYLLGAAAATLALLLQESGVCADAARATSLLVEAGTVSPADDSGPSSPDWSSLEQNAREAEKRACGRDRVPSAQANPPR